MVRWTARIATQQLRTGLACSGRPCLVKELTEALHVLALLAAVRVGNHGEALARAESAVVLVGLDALPDGNRLLFGGRAAALAPAVNLKANGGSLVEYTDSRLVSGSDERVPVGTRFVELIVGEVLGKIFPALGSDLRPDRFSMFAVWLSSLVLELPVGRHREHDATILRACGERFTKNCCLLALRTFPESAKSLI